MYPAFLFRLSNTCTCACNNSRKVRENRGHNLAGDLKSLALCIYRAEQAWFTGQITVCLLELIGWLYWGLTPL